MGSMSHRTSIDISAELAAATANLALGCTSSTGNSKLGVGWSLAVPTIERTTLLWALPPWLDSAKHPRAPEIGEL